MNTKNKPAVDVLPSAPVAFLKGGYPKAVNVRVTIFGHVFAASMRWERVFNGVGEADTFEPGALTIKVSALVKALEDEAFAAPLRVRVTSEFNGMTDGMESPEGDRAKSTPAELLAWLKEHAKNTVWITYYRRDRRIAIGSYIKDFEIVDGVEADRQAAALMDQPLPKIECEGVNANAAAVKHARERYLEPLAGIEFDEAVAALRAPTAPSETLRMVLEDPRSIAARVAHAQVLPAASPLRRLIQAQYAVETAPSEKDRLQAERKADALVSDEAFLEGVLPEIIKDVIPKGSWATLKIRLGFVEGIALSAAAWLAHHQQLRAVAPIRHLRITNLTNTRVDELGSALNGLWSLDLGGVGLRSADVETLAETPAVQELYCILLADNPDVGIDAVKCLAARKLAKLRYVDLSGTGAPLNEVLELDGETVAHAFMPYDALRLEAELGHQISWLRMRPLPLNAWEAHPDPFRFAAEAAQEARYMYDARSFVSPACTTARA